jgi:hypothetical protein
LSAAFFSSSGSSTDFPIIPSLLQQQHRHLIPPWAFACKVRASLYRVSDRHLPIHIGAPGSQRHSEEARSGATDSFCWASRIGLHDIALVLRPQHFGNGFPSRNRAS